MKKLAIGLLAGLIVIGTVLGSLALSVQHSVGNPIEIPIPTITLEIISAVSPTPMPRATLTVAPTSTVPLSPTVTPTSTPTACPIPADWQRYVVGAFDTLLLIARRFNTTVDQIAQANCLLQPIVSVGQTIFVPPLGPTPTLAVCYPPFGWLPIVVRPGDTLSSIAQRYGISVYYLARANCLSSTFIYAGQTIYVPPFAPIATFTPTPIAPTDTPTATPIPTTIAPTTVVPTIETLTPTVTPPSETVTPPTPTDTPTPTETPMSLPTDTPTPPPTNTPAPLPTDTPTPPPTNTPAPVLPTDTLSAPTIAPAPSTTP